MTYVLKECGVAATFRYLPFSLTLRLASASVKLPDKIICNLIFIIN